MEERAIEESLSGLATRGVEDEFRPTLPSRLGRAIEKRSRSVVDAKADDDSACHELPRFPANILYKLTRTHDLSEKNASSAPCPILGTTRARSRYRLNRLLVEPEEEVLAVDVFDAGSLFACGLVQRLFLPPNAVVKDGKGGRVAVAVAAIAVVVSLVAVGGVIGAYIWWRRRQARGFSCVFMRLLLLVVVR